MAPSNAATLSITIADIISGHVRVIGAGAAASAQITWQGGPVTIASSGGSFQFTTSVLPPTCVGAVSDGVSTIHVVVRGCGPQATSGQGTVITLADGLVVPGRGFVDLAPVAVDGFEHVSFLGFATPSEQLVVSTPSFLFAFRTEPGLYGDPGSQFIQSGCSFSATVNAIGFGLSCGG